MDSKNISTEVTTLNEVSLKVLVHNIKEWFAYLQSKILIICLVSVFGGLLGFCFAYFKQSSYSATTTFVLSEDSGSGGLGNLGGLASMVGVDIGGSGGGIFQGDNILELYKSRTMIEKALLTEVDYNGKNQLLVSRYINFKGLKKKWDKKNELKNFKFTLKYLPPNSSSKRLQDSVLGTIVDDLNKTSLNVAKPDKKLSIIKVEVKAEDEVFAKSFNNAIVENVNQFYIETKTKKSLENVSILQQKVDSVRSVMNGAIYRAAATNDATPNLNPTRQIQRAAPVQRSQFSAETNKAILEELVKNLELSKISLRRETPLIQVIDQPIYPLKKEVFGTPKGTIMGMIIFFLLTCIWLFFRRSFALQNEK